MGPSESEVGPTLHRLIRGADGRVIVACFASNVGRVQQIIDAAVALGRRVSFVGRSMVRNMGIARELGFLQVDDRRSARYRRRRDDGARTGGADHHRHPGRADVGAVADVARRTPQHHADRRRPDHLSSSLIPGNEEAVYGVIDALSKIGARVVTNQQVRVHVSGHAYAGELLFLYNGVRPRNVMPVHGTWRIYAPTPSSPPDRCPEESIVLAENGVSVDLVGGAARIAGAVPVGKMFVDGLITGDVGESRSANG